MSKLREAVIAKPTRPLKLEVKEICDRLDYLFLQTDGGYKLPFDNPALFDVLGMMIGLKAALAEQEEAQEPVAWQVADDTTEPELYACYHQACQDAWDTDFGTFDTNTATVTPLYTKPQPLKRLSKGEADKLLIDCWDFDKGEYDAQKFANAIQDAVQEKNR